MTAAQAPIQPLTPPDADLRSFPGMMIDIPRLFASEFNAEASRQPLAWMVGVKLWCRAFHQVPAGSLPDDDGQLCHLAELGFDEKSFLKAKPLALRGWRRASDGRLYHRVVALTVLEAWIERLLNRLSSQAGNAKRHQQEFNPAAINVGLEVAESLLRALDPNARGLDRLKRRQLRRTAPIAIPMRHAGTPSGSPDDLPMTSQEKVKGSGRDSTSLRSVEGGVDAQATSPRGELAVDQKRQAQIASLLAGLIKAAGPALGDIANCPGLVSPIAILRLTEPAVGEPCDLELDVLPTVAEVCASRPPRSLTSWTYLEKPILRSRDRRLAGNPPPIKAETIIHERASSRHTYPVNGRAASRSVWANIEAAEKAAQGAGG